MNYVVNVLSSIKKN